MSISTGADNIQFSYILRSLLPVKPVDCLSAQFTLNLLHALIP